MIHNFRYPVERGKVTFRYSKHDLDVNGLHSVLLFVNSIHKKFGETHIPILLDFGNIKISDKLTLTLLECICYSLISSYKHNVEISFNCINTIGNEGIRSSPLLLLGSKRQTRIQDYQAKHKSEIYGNHFRRIVSADAAQTGDLSAVMGDIDFFLKYFSVIDAYRADIAEVVVELIGNAGEHAKSECIVDIDITNEYTKDGTGGKYYGVNIAVVNFSETSFIDALRVKIEDPDMHEERYELVRKALEFHNEGFTDEYSIDDFYRVAAFQDRITSRPEKQKSGGKGLTKLICSLEQRSDFHRCYMLSGNRILWFRQECLEYDDDGWIGFNNSNNFFTCLPERTVFSTTTINFPGTAYNLNFVLKKEE
ncbi:MAG: hypothetical protein VB034_09160 [Eubacteriales bacterium]|nr:hypothetical protein [Eubacteriales bacterium]